MTAQDSSVRTSRVSPVWLVLGGILSVQFGAGIAIFGRLQKHNAPGDMS